LQVAGTCPGQQGKAGVFQIVPPADIKRALEVGLQPGLESQKSCAARRWRR